MRRPLGPDQARAVDPRDVVWLSASAGTGKTHVLTSRVLRLLLAPGVTPDRILCLTFTKAGATEMAARINRELAAWVRMPETVLFQALEDIGAPAGPEAVAKARTLFAKVLDCPGGGLRIETIHAFSQWLLSAFPAEVGMQPGFRPMEDRDRLLLAGNVLADLVADAAARGDQLQQHTLSDLMQRFGRRDTLDRFLLSCAAAPQLWIGRDALTGDLLPHIEQALGLPAGASPDMLAQLLDDDRFDTVSLRLCMRINLEWGTATGTKSGGQMADWLAKSPADRLTSLTDLTEAMFTGKGDVRSLGYLQRKDNGYGDYAENVRRSIDAVVDLQTLLDLARWLAPAFTLGRDFALRFAEAKAREGFIDYDDQIRLAAQLLGENDLADWVRFKLDRQFDHVLVDEAQDTNASQWGIIHALTDEYFAGLGARGDTIRTLFVVGDYKQAIFGFQGTSPENFAKARKRVRDLAHHASRPFQDVPLARSFRTSQPVLDFVDSIISAEGHAALGLEDAPEPHVGANRPGRVVLLNAVTRTNGVADSATDDGSDDDPASVSNDNGEESSQQGWLSRTDRQLAERIALQVRRWLDDGHPLFKDGQDGKPRNARPGDIMVLVRRRAELAGLIVARLYAAGVPVAGVDRMRLAAPLAVRDVMAALRFAAQPYDDLSLAALLVSPLFGWSQDDLLAYGYRDKGVALWDHLRKSHEPAPVAAVSALVDVLRRADYEPPQATIEWILGGPWQGRRRLVARLGAEANDPLDELVNQAARYAASHPPLLDGFIHWFDASQDELKREDNGDRELVRVMTVHGSKGLESPIVILADAADDPARKLNGHLDLPLGENSDDGRSLRLPYIRKHEKRGVLAELADAARAHAEQEHWRLLYVAMTRAEEALYIVGATNSKQGKIAERSWYASAERAMLAAGHEKLSDPLWGGRYEWGNWPLDVVTSDTDQPDSTAALAEPEWLRAPIGPEPRPPRPLAPSSLGPDDAVESPQIDAAVLAAAARRGVLMHRLLERLPDLPSGRRHAAATRWLAQQAPELDDSARAEMRDSALGVLAQSGWTDLFGPGSLAEVPITATVDGIVIAGAADRLLITPDLIRIVDYKTARRPPAGLAEVPPAYLRQMAAYARALSVIYPGRRVEAALLYTAGPQLIAIPDAMLKAQTIGSKAEP